jgi:RNA polymerase sigma-70 factor (ECF subfamily)
MAIAGSPTSLSDEALAALAKRGDRDSFEALVRRYRDIAVCYAYARLGTREEAEDIAQEAFVRALMSLGRFRLDASWAAWLMRIVRNLCHDALRKRRVRRYEELDMEWPDSRPTPEMQTMLLESRNELLRAVYALDEKFRTPLLMHYQASRSYKEISLALGVPESTVVGRMAGGLRALRRKLVIT